MSESGTKNTEKIVRAYSGSRLDETPRFIVLDGKEYPIKEIFPLGLSNEFGEYYRVYLAKLEDGRTFKLIQWEDRWSVIEF